MWASRQGSLGPVPSRPQPCNRRGHAVCVMQMPLCLFFAACICADTHDVLVQLRVGGGRGGSVVLVRHTTQVAGHGLVHAWTICGSTSALDHPRRMRTKAGKRWLCCVAQGAVGGET